MVQVCLLTVLKAKAKLTPDEINSTAYGTVVYITTFRIRMYYIERYEERDDGRTDWLKAAHLLLRRHVGGDR
jgi:hypothetical protein